MTEVAVENFLGPNIQLIFRRIGNYFALQRITSGQL